MENTSHMSKWSSGISDICADPRACLCSSFCPCVVFGRNVKNVTDGKVTFVRASLTYLLLGGCFAVLACHIVGPLGYWITCVPCYAAKYRRQLREKADLPEIPLSDFQMHCCCHPCALDQEYREIKSWHSDIAIGPSKPTVDRGPEETIAKVQPIQKMER